tara:strand:- start:629 stop:925 length:297 start_codon:yes stop_codon:yes gene_type:complete
MDYKVDTEFESINKSNPNMDSGYARLLVAILQNAIHDALSSQTSVVNRRQAWHFLEYDDGLIHWCLAVVNLDRKRMLNHLRNMQNKEVNLKTMFKREY